MKFSDITIVPQYSEVPSRADVNLEYTHITKISNRELKGFPVFVSNMDTTGVFSLAKAVNQYGFFTCLHKYYSLEELREFFKEENSERSFVTCGLGNTEVENAHRLVEEGLCNRVCFDVANGYIKRFHSIIKDFRDVCPNAIIIAGNVATQDGVELLYNAGADIVKCGIANGSACDTANKAGINISQPDTIIDCKHKEASVMSDGGCKTPADIVKALALGANFVMCGGMFAGHDENGHHWTTDERGRMITPFYGMSSAFANEKYNGGLKDYRTSEGKELLINYKGSVSLLCKDIRGSLASACSYSNCWDINHFHRNVRWTVCK